MKIADPSITRIAPETLLIAEHLSLDGKHLVELGCGKAEITRLLATGGLGRTVLATEVDAIQHDQNLLITDLPNVTFRLGGAEAISAEDESADVVFMFKSLHHVPITQMDNALQEIHRVLRPGGAAWISEPVFAGDFNEILRLFHDESEVREAAFLAIKRAVDRNLFCSSESIFFSTPRHFADFAEFETRVLKVTHTHHQLDPSLYEEVRGRFEAHMGADGARFNTPIRVNLLRKA